MSCCRRKYWKEFLWGVFQGIILLLIFKLAGCI